MSHNSPIRHGAEAVKVISKDKAAGARWDEDRAGWLLFSRECHQENPSLGYIG
jgi:hypothetical protein